MVTKMAVARISRGGPPLDTLAPGWKVHVNKKKDKKEKYRQTRSSGRKRL